MATDRRVNRITMRQISGSARSKKVRVDLGAESDFSDLPKLVKVGTANYFLVKGNEGYRMLSTLCPHQGGEVEDVGEDVSSATPTATSMRRTTDAASTTRA